MSTTCVNHPATRQRVPGLRLLVNPRGAARLAPALAALLLTGAAWPVPAAAQQSPAVAAEAERIVVDGEDLSYDQQTGIVTAVGNVVVRRGEAVLRAQRVRVNVETGEAVAYGAIMFQPSADASPWTGTDLRYNFNTGESSIESPSVRSEPFVLSGARSERMADGTIAASGASVTTCTNAPGSAHYRITASRVVITPGRRMTGRNAVVWFGPIPAFYWPIWRWDLDGSTGFRVYPGYGSRMGAILLTSYRARLNPALRSETHVDYRSKRGVAFGQDLKWRDPRGDWSGAIEGYTLDDKEPLEGKDADRTDIDNERYRVRFEHGHSLGDRDTIQVSADYLSDPDVLKDFFRRDYRKANQPDNFVVYTYRGDSFTAGVQARKRLNDFYDDLDRLPELSADFLRRELADSRVYYEGATSAGFLERLYAEGSTNENYSAFRFDTAHTVYRPARFGGFLNVIPRAGWRGTYYSETVEWAETLELVRAFQTNQVVRADGSTGTVVVVTESTNTVSRSVDTGADMRSMVELGFEVSFKAFKTWDGGHFSPLRHVVEPYANYTFVPEPSLTPDQIPQFDAVDALGEQHNVKLGVRNTYQTKRDDRPATLLNLDTYTWYRLDDEGDNEKGVDDLYATVEFMPTKPVRIDADVRYDLDESELDRFNIRLRLARRTWWETATEYRFRRDESSLLAANFTVFPNRNWDLNTFARYEFEDSRAEEVGGYVQRNLDCMSVRTGVSVLPGYTKSDGTEQDEEWLAMIELYLTAFPSVGFSARHRDR